MHQHSQSGGQFDLDASIRRPRYFASWFYTVRERRAATRARQEFTKRFNEVPRPKKKLPFNLARINAPGKLQQQVPARYRASLSHFSLLFSFPPSFFSSFFFFFFYLVDRSGKRRAY